MKIEIFNRPHISLNLIFAGFLLTISSSERLSNPIGANIDSKIGTIIFLFFTSFTLNIIYLICLHNFIKKLTLYSASKIILSFYFLLSLLFIYFYPKFGASISSNSYGDRDDALQIVSQQILKLRNPYEISTYLGENQIPSPTINTSLIYILPIKIGISPGYLNIILLGLIIILVIITKSQYEALPIFGIAFANPSFIEDFLLGGDYFVFPLFLLVLLVILIRIPNLPVLLIWSYLFIPISGYRSTQIIFLSFWFIYVLSEKLKYKFLHLMSIILNAMLILFSAILNSLAGTNHFTFNTSASTIAFCASIFMTLWIRFIFSNKSKYTLEKIENLFLYISFGAIILLPGIINNIHLWGHIWPNLIFGIYLLYKRHAII